MIVGKKTYHSFSVLGTILRLLQLSHLSSAVVENQNFIMVIEIEKRFTNYVLESEMSHLVINTILMTILGTTREVK